MRKVISVLVVLAIIGAIVLGVKGSDIMGYIYDFFKNLSVFCYGIMIKIADAFQEFITTHQF